jgi:hypothetical protein
MRPLTSTARRSVFISLVVGTVIIAVNQGPALADGDLPSA